MSPGDMLWGAIAALLSAAVGLGLLVEAFRAGLPRRTWVSLLVLFAGSFLIREHSALFGPGDLHMNLRDVTGEAPDPYGPGPWGALWWLRALRIEELWPLFGLNLLAGSLTPVVVQRALAQRHAASLWPWAAALFIATSPLLVRYSGVANRQTAVLFLVSVALWGALSSGHARYRWRLAIGAGAALLATLFRPEAVFLVPIFAAMAVAAAPRRPHPWVASAVVGVGWLGYLFSSSRLRELLFGSDAFEPRAPSRRLAVWLDPGYVGVFALAALLVSVVVWVFRPNRFALLCLGAAVGVVVATASYPIDDLNIANARYQSVGVLFAAIFAAYGVSLGLDRAAALGRRPQLALVALALALFVATRLPPLRAVTRATTVDLEFALLLERLPELGEHGLVYSVDGRAVDAALRPPRYLSRFGVVGTWLFLDEPVPPEHGDRPIHYYHSASCSVDPMSLVGEPTRIWEFRRDCALAQEQLLGDAVWEVVLPTIPLTWERWREDVVRVGLYRTDPPGLETLLARRRPAQSGPAVVP